ncbi:diguanylate cyclase domain-containing protein [Sporosarcina beigongshangi]|uniref:diguanylate cyclase domain-containing protein n=1 Tax=Sporosarcina beigongshangi TaxID=2782538 RepID=UPI00193931AD|nr:diguanylate cyclase [Sporosarcina beigongshangi]
MDELTNLGIGVNPTIDEYQLIWENTNDAIFILRKDGAIIQANPALQDILGWSLEEIEGVSRPPFFMDDFTQEDHQKQLDVLRSGESTHYFETKRKHKDGTVKDVLASYRAINNEDVLAVAMYKDITKEKQTQHQLTVAESCYRTLVEYSPDAILVQSDDALTFVNPEAIKLLGAKNEDQLIGKAIWDFIEPKDGEDRSRVIDALKSLEAVKTDPMIEKFVRFDGTTIWVEMIAIPVQHGGERVIQAILRDITVRKYYEDQLTYMATYDPMTGVVNRSTFIEALEIAVEQKDIFAVLYLDLDKFKSINDSLGHAVGDELLIQFAGRMRDNIRSMDAVGRIGGDEFLILLQDMNPSKVEKIVSRMLKHFSEPYVIAGQKVFATSSIGIAMYPADGADVATLMDNADKALYKAKEKRNHFEFYQA